MERTYRRPVSEDELNSEFAWVTLAQERGRQVGRRLRLRLGSCPHLLAGSILPVYSDWYQVAFFIYTDSIGAEYPAGSEQRECVDVQGRRVSQHDANSRRMYFNDGAFWYMGGGGRDDSMRARCFQR